MNAPDAAVAHPKVDHTDNTSHDDPTAIPDTRCVDCNVDTINVEDPYGTEYYMVHDTVWVTAGMDRFGGFLCIGCLETRLGRRLTIHDFTDCELNLELQSTGICTPRLHERLCGW